MYARDQTTCSWQRIFFAPFGIIFYALAYVPFCWALLLQSSVTRSPVLPEQAATLRKPLSRSSRPSRPTTAAAAAAAAAADSLRCVVSQWETRISPLAWASSLFLFAAALTYCVGSPFVFDAEMWFHKFYAVPLGILNLIAMLMTLDYGTPRKSTQHNVDRDGFICSATRRKELRLVKACRPTNSRLCCWQRPFRYLPIPQWLAQPAQGSSLRLRLAMILLRCL
jgi:hypothetical protein